MRLDDLVNTTLGRYQVEALIGRGGMAAVYRAFDPALERPVALKVLYPQFLADADLVARFRREAVTAARLDHPHIAPIYDVGEANGLVYLALKILPGPSLAELLQQQGRLPPAKVVALAEEIASALDEAHRHGIVHRDIKPGNVLFDARGRAMLTDFGIAKSLDSAGLTETSVIVGTPDYIAPEQIDGRLAPNGQIDGRADVYAFGALLYRTLTGQRPFGGTGQAVLLAQLRDDPPTPSSVLPSLPPEVDAVILRAMAKDPEQRPRTAGEVAQGLAAALSDATAVGAVFPPSAVRGHPHQQRTTEAPVFEPVAMRAPQAAVVASDGVVAVTPAGRLRFLRSRLVLALLTLAVVTGVGLGLAQVVRGRQDGPTGSVGGNGSVAVADATPSATATTQPISAGTSTVVTITTAVPPTATTQPSASATLPATATQTPTATDTPTPTNSPSPTFVPVATTALPTATRPAPVVVAPPPATAVPPTRRPTARPTATAVPPRPTATPVPPTATRRPPAPTATTVPPTPKPPEPTLVPPTPIPPSATTIPPSATTIPPTPVPPTPVPPTATPVPPTPKPKPPTATPEPPTPVPPTATAVVAGCDHKLLTGGFGRLWNRELRVRTALGCALSAEAPSAAAEQIFERGMMYWVGATQRFYVFTPKLTGAWSTYPNNYSDGEELPPLEPPPGLYAPVRGFGKLWRSYPSISDAVGWGTAPEAAMTGVYQRFEGGTLLYSQAVNGHAARIYALFGDGTYATYIDVQ